VRPDHFLRQFDRHPEGEPRLAAMAAHHAWSYNHHHDEVRELEGHLEQVIERLRTGDTAVAVALDLHIYLEERRR
jgi:hypothetical protein